MCGGRQRIANPQYGRLPVCVTMPAAAGAGMKTREGHTVAADPPRETKEESPGLPGLRTWRAVYAVVFGYFVLWVLLLFGLTRLFS